jgi:hypothetical protein
MNLYVLGSFFPGLAARDRVKSQNNTVRLMKEHPAKQAWAQVVGNISRLSFTSLDPSTSRLMSTHSSCIYYYVSGIRPPTLTIIG